MARRKTKRKTRTVYRYIKRAKRKMGIPSIASIVSVAGPQIAINSGISPDMGYSAIGDALQGNFSGALWKFGANEIMAFTGYDIGKGKFNFKPPLLTYGVPIAIKLLRRFVGPVKAGPVRLL